MAKAPQPQGYHQSGIALLRDYVAEATGAPGSTRGGSSRRWLSTIAWATSMTPMAVVLRMVAQHLEGSICIDCMAGHQDPLRLLDRGPPPKRSLQAVVLGETLQCDVDRALELGRGVLDDVRKHAPLGGLVHVGGILGRQQCDHRAGRLADDLGDQVEGMLGVQTQSHQCDVGPLSGCHGADFLDVDLTCDHLVPEPGHDLGEQFEPLALLVRDQDT